MSKNAIVIGAGIAGLSIVRMLVQKGYKVAVYEQSQKAYGASIRNFGMIWPVGQVGGMAYNSAIRSKEIWRELSTVAGFDINYSGCLHVAKDPDEWQVLEELHASFKSEQRPVELLDASTINQRYALIKTEKLLGGLFSADECTVSPVRALSHIAAYYEEQHEILFHWNKTVQQVRATSIVVENKRIEADLVFVCSGSSIGNLYPEIFLTIPITLCKLQMMRFKPDPSLPILGVSVCGGLSLIHYKSFEVAPSLKKIKEKYKQEMFPYINNGIHVMVSQNNHQELTVGDSHHYAKSHDPFDNCFINNLILDYLSGIVKTDNWEMTETWNGVYAKMTDGSPYFFEEVESGVFIYNGLGGTGMTMSFSIAEKLLINL